MARWCAYGFATAVLALAGCGGTSSGDSRSLTILVAADGGQNYDPQTNASPSSTQYMMPVFDTLLTEDRTGHIGPGLATRATYSDGGKTLTLALRPGVTFHDGQPFDAAAVKANVERGLTNPKSVIAAQLGPVTKVLTPDPGTAVFKLKAPSGALLGYLTGAAGMMASPKAWKNPDYSTNPVGTGPWAVSKDSTPGSDMVYRRYPRAWRADEARVDTLHIRAGVEATFVPSLTSDAAQAVMLTGAPADGDTLRDHHRSVREAQVSYLHLLYLNKAKLFDDPRVRRAMSLAIDRRLMCDTLLEGTCTPTGQPFAPRSWAYDPDLSAPRQDVTRARALLKAAGHPRGFAFRAVVSSAGTELQSELTAIQQMLDDVGIRMSIQPLPVSQLVGELASGRAQAYYSVNTGGADPAIPLALMLAPTYNPGDYADPKLSGPLKQAGAAVGQADRQSAYRAIGAAFQESAFDVVVLNQDLRYATARGAQGLTARDPLTIEARGATR